MNNQNLPNNPNIQVVKATETGLFTNYIFKAIPLAFDESMSYYETLCGILSYLKDTILPTLNNNADAVVELQTLFIQLNNYVEHYFDNLDVQEEINNKLDSLVEDGTLTTLIGNYIDPYIDAQNQEINEFKNDVNEEINEFKIGINNEINDFESNVNNEINDFEDNITNEVNEINTKVDNVASGSPLVASSTTEMTDTTRVYVNTTDGKWYYYDGDSWEIGGTYQSSGIADGSITYLKLDDKLQSNFFDNYGTPIDLGTSQQGYMKIDGTIQSSSSYEYFTYSLTNGKSYIFTGKNLAQCVALLIKDSNNNIIFCSQNDITVQANYNIKFDVKENGLTAYISRYVNPNTDRLSTLFDGQLRELTTIYNQLKYSDTIPLIETLSNMYTSTNTSYISFNTYGTSDYYTTYIYQMTKGRTYKVEGYDNASVCTLAYTDLNFHIQYQSNTESLGPSGWRPLSKTWTAENDGFICLVKFGGGEYPPATIEVVNDGVNITGNTNKLIGKKIGADGDSIMNGSGNDNISYVNLIALRNNMSLQKIAVGGGTIATGTYSDGNPRHWISTSVLNLADDCDIILINGGINDWNNHVTLGEITSGYDSEVDSTTFYGGLETLCRNLLSKFKTGQKIYFVTNHNVLNIYNSSTPTFREYLNAIYEVMRKYGIEVIDIGKNTHFNTGIDYFKNNYTTNGDGIHPNTNGFNYFYVPYIEGILKQEL